VYKIDYFDYPASLTSGLLSQSSDNYFSSGAGDVGETGDSPKSNTNSESRVTKVKKFIVCPHDLTNCITKCSEPAKTYKVWRQAFFREDLALTVFVVLIGISLLRDDRPKGSDLESRTSWRAQLWAGVVIALLGMSAYGALYVYGRTLQSTEFSEGELTLDMQPPPDLPKADEPWTVHAIVLTTQGDEYLFLLKNDRQVWRIPAKRIVRFREQLKLDIVAYKIQNSTEACRRSDSQ
jgi:hypothetical protein